MTKTRYKQMLPHWLVGILPLGGQQMSMLWLLIQFMSRQIRLQVHTTSSWAGIIQQQANE